MSVDQLLSKQKLHVDQLMQDDRVKKLVQHLADHAYLQGHIHGEHKPGSCEGCEDLLVKLFPEKSKS